jgi:hypothetical protein
MNPQLIITVLYFSSAIASLCFVARYMFKRWWLTTAGRLVMGLHLTMVGFGVSSTLVLLHGLNYTGRIILSIALFTLFNVVMWGFSLELHKAQAANKQQASTEKDLEARELSS